MSWSRRLAALLPGTVAQDTGGTEPDPRFTFANERTFLAWSRTALALVIAGLGIVQLLPPFPGVPAGRHLLGLPLIALGAVLATTAYVEWVHSQRALRRAPCNGCAPVRERRINQRKKNGGHARGHEQARLSVRRFDAPLDGRPVFPQRDGGEK